MAKRIHLSNLFILISILYFNGFKSTCSMFYQTFKYMNSFLIQLYNTSVLSVYFKYCITFPIVGIILTLFGSLRGKEGYIIGKLLYFIVGYSVCIVLDFISKFIF